MVTNREYEEFKRRTARQYTYDELLELWPDDMVIRFKGKRNGNE
jgi:hypothetical protein